MSVVCMCGMYDGCGMYSVGCCVWRACVCGVWYVCSCVPLVCTRVVYMVCVCAYVHIT